MKNRGGWASPFKALASQHTLTWAVWLVSLYIAAQMIADISATKMVDLFGIVLPGGTFIYAVTFTLTDFMQRKLGKRVADLTVVAAGVVNVLMALYFIFVIKMPYPVFWGGQDAFAATLGIVWMIVAPSILAEVVSGLLDNFIYELFEKPWAGMLVSNLLSVPTDSIVFAGLAFYVLPRIFPGGHAMTGAELFAVIKGQTLIKWVVGAVIMPIMALVRRSERTE